MSDNKRKERTLFVSYVYTRDVDEYGYENMGFGNTTDFVKYEGERVTKKDIVNMQNIIKHELKADSVAILNFKFL